MSRHSLSTLLIDDPALVAGTHRVSALVRDWSRFSLQWEQTTAAGAVSAINVYVSAADEQFLADENPATNPLWVLDTGYIFSSLPAGAGPAASAPLTFLDECLTAILVEVVVTVDVGLRLHFLGKEVD